MFRYPFAEVRLQALGFQGGAVQIEALDLLSSGLVQGSKNDGDGAVGEFLGERSSSGKGFGGEDVALAGFAGVTGADLRAAGEDSAQGGVFGGRGCRRWPGIRRAGRWGSHQGAG